MNNEWIQCIVAFIRKNKDPINLDDYRPVALLNAIYKIWACVVGNRLTPLLNLLTDEAQTAYKPRRSEIGAISQIENDVEK